MWAIRGQAVAKCQDSCLDIIEIYFIRVYCHCHCVVFTLVVPQPAITIGNCYDSNRRQVFSLELCLQMVSFGGLLVFTCDLVQHLTASCVYILCRLELCSVATSYSSYCEKTRPKV